jgi:hypothetical protein
LCSIASLIYSGALYYSVTYWKYRTRSGLQEIVMLPPTLSCVRILIPFNAAVPSTSSTAYTM